MQYCVAAPNAPTVCPSQYGPLGSSGDGGAGGGADGGSDGGKVKSAPASSSSGVAGHGMRHT